ncbi:MAG: DUF5916 domain-containing protein [Acidobacteria bacterium]|nr:DUF5916 domain-containing protein [Acidobacteriota bacterium]
MMRLIILLILLQSGVMAQQSQPAGGQHGNRSLRIHRITEAPTLDGILNEQVWRDAPVTGDFLQRDPSEGMPASEKTEVLALYDDQNLYFGVRCFDSQAEGILATELRRDNSFGNDDSFAIILDTFHDHRNAFLFRINPMGTQYDALITEEGRVVNQSWDEKWEVEAHTDEEGWSAEIKIPLRSIRFSASGENPTFGIDFERVIRRKNEFTYWNNYRRGFSFRQISQGGHLTGVEVEAEVQLRVKPYINTRVLTRGQEERSTILLGDIGLEDLKYPLTSSLTLELTANTDFAQTEVDNQIINFDRVSLFFPEKRDFFLEGAGIFDFGTVRSESSTEIKLYHSRRIGLSSGQAIPILVGGKVSGKLGDKYTVGFLDVQTDDFQGKPGDNFAVFRLKRDLFSRSSIGLSLTNRQAEGGDFNRVFGVDQNLVFFDHLKLTGMVSKSFTDGVQDKEWIGAVGGVWQDDLFDIGFDYWVKEENFEADLGFLSKRGGMRKYVPHLIFTPRPQSETIRQFRWGVRYDNFRRPGDDRPESEMVHILNITSFQNGSTFRGSPHYQIEDVKADLSLPGGLVVPPGHYSWWRLPVTYAFNPARKFSGSFGYRFEPDYYGAGGKRHRVQINPVLKLGSNFSTSISYTFFDVQLSGGEAVKFHQVNNRLNISLSRKWLTSTLVQYNSTSDLIGINFRLNYIYRPGDDLFIVFNDFRNRSEPVTELDRSLTVKLTHSFEF